MVDDLRVGWPATRVRITTDNGSVDQQVIRGAGSHNYAVAAGVTRKVRITLLSLVVGRQDGKTVRPSGCIGVIQPGVKVVEHQAVHGAIMARPDASCEGWSALYRPRPRTNASPFGVPTPVRLSQPAATWSDWASSSSDRSNAVVPPEAFSLLL